MNRRHAMGLHRTDPSASIPVKAALRLTSVVSQTTFNQNSFSSVIFQACFNQFYNVASLTQSNQFSHCITSNLTHSISFSLSVVSQTTFNQSVLPLWYLRYNLISFTTSISDLIQSVFPLHYLKLNSVNQFYLCGISDLIQSNSFISVVTQTLFNQTVLSLW